MIFSLLVFRNCSLQAVVYVSVRSEKEGLTHQVMVTELFGPVQEDGQTAYVAAATTDDGMPTTNQQKGDATNNGSMV